MGLTEPAVRVLGPIDVKGPAGVADISPGIRRCLVGLLALEVGRVVSQSRLAEALWGDEPPRTALRSLQSHVARVRRSLGDCGLAGALRTYDPGYVLDLDARLIDVNQFDELRSGARDLVHDNRLPEASIALHEALRLWRGDPLGGALVYGWGEAAATRLAEARLIATEELWDLELRLGGHDRALPELEQLAALHPTRERVIGLLMLSMYRSGRGGEALEVFRRHRATMVGELGVEPGPDVQRLHTRMLRQDPALEVTQSRSRIEVSARPSQLPPAAGYFVGREAQSARLDAVLSAEGGDAPPVVVICGPAGVGKTSLVTQWARRHRERFAGGELFVDLHGHAQDDAMSVAGALAYLLRALGLRPEAIPAGVPEQSARLRTLLDERRMLVVLDNAATTDQVLPMVPAGGSSLLVVTSRNRLPGIAAHHHVLTLRLDVLAPGDSVGLLSKVLGERRVGDEPDAAARLADLCGHLPLALRIAAAKLAARPDLSIAGFSAELAASDRLGQLEVEGDSRSVRTVFSTAYHGLPPAQALVFRMLGLHPGVVFGSDTAAALCGVSPREAADGLASLQAAHLISEVERCRYRFHDLIRLYAAERAAAEIPPVQRDLAIERLLEWYLAVGHAANRLIDPGRDRVNPTPKHRPAGIPSFRDAADALSFLDKEEPNLVPVAAQAVQHGAAQAAWQLAYLMVGYLDSRGHSQQREWLWRWGLAAAESLGDPGTEGLARSGLGLTYIRMRRFDEALRQLARAMDLMQIAGDKRGLGHAHNSMALVYTKRRHFRRAADSFQRALQIHEATDHRMGVVLALNNLGYVLALGGRIEAALEHLQRARPLVKRLGNSRLEAAILRTLGNVHFRAGDTREALRLLHLSVEIKRRVHDDSYLVEALNDLADIHCGTGDPGAAHGVAEEALALARRLDDHHLRAASGLRLAKALNALGEPHAAREHLREALRLRQDAPDEYEQAQLHEELAVVADRLGGAQEGRRLRESAIALYEDANALAEAKSLRATP